MDDPSRDYRRIEAALTYLETHATAQPSLSDVAEHLGLSEHHVQRLFKRFAGVSPKRFLQFLTIQHARALLRESASILDTSYATGLSGPSRLHDLFVSVEAMTPGTYKAQGQGLTIRTGVHPTPFGECLVGLTERGVCWLSFHSDAEGARADLFERYPRAALVSAPADTAPVAERLVDSSDPVQLFVGGTNFELAVWRALLKIPFGARTTYGAVAKAVGRPTASRAVGRAVGANPVAYLIPCHRVIRSSGSFKGYRWGNARKQALLGWESARGQPLEEPA